MPWMACKCGSCGGKGDFMIEHGEGSARCISCGCELVSGVEIKPLKDGPKLPSMAEYYESVMRPKSEPTEAEREMDEAKDRLEKAFGRVLFAPQRQFFGLDRFPVVDAFPRPVDEFECLECGRVNRFYVKALANGKCTKCGAPREAAAKPAEPETNPKQQYFGLDRSPLPEPEPEPETKFVHEAHELPHGFTVDFEVYPPCEDEERWGVDVEVRWPGVASGVLSREPCWAATGDEARAIVRDTVERFRTALGGETAPETEDTPEPPKLKAWVSFP